MYKRPIIMLMIFGALMILVGTGFTANEKPVVADQANQSSLSNKACSDKSPNNCDMGKPCTPKELEKCQANCKSMKECTPEKMEKCKKSCSAGNSCAQMLSSKVNSNNSTDLSLKQCNPKKACQTKTSNSKGNI